METVSICPICGSTQFSPYITVKDYTITKEVFQLVTCISCRFIITNPRPPQSDIGKYYASEDYISHSGKSKTTYDKIYLTARNFTLKWKHHLTIKHLPENGTVLDYGCGTGEFLSYLKNKKCNVLGIEPNKLARDKANSKLAGKVFEKLDEIHGHDINIVTLWHVLEHVHELNHTIQKLKNFLTTNGRIIIAVPNPNSHDSRKYKGDWAGYDVPRHLWHFTQESMTALMKRNGLKVEAIKPMKLDSFYVSLLSEQYKHPGKLKLLYGINAFIEGISSNYSARKNSEYSSLIYIVAPE